jgi:hypothetical protein
MTEQPAIYRLSEPAATGAWRAFLAEFPGTRRFYFLVSLLVLLPVYWQPRVQAGDLSSHIYNAWLVQLIESGRTQGLVIVGQTTNVLFDLMLSGLFRILGAEAAQRISVSIAVLTFVWGAFAFVCAVSRNRPWHLLTCITMLAYGWVFHMGFFNFYLSMGICFWAMALLWNASHRRIAISVGLLVLAYVAQALPVVWSLGLLAYLFIARRVSVRVRGYVTALWLSSLVLFHIVIGRALVTRWSLQQIAVTTGLDQIWVFDGKYYVVLVGLLFVWGLLFLDIMHRSGGRQIVTSVPFQICLISSMAVFILPGTVLIPGFHHALVYIAERMSLGVGICICALLAGAQPRPFVRGAAAVVALVFFGFLFHDERALNAFEDRMQDTVGQISPGQRVINGVEDPGLRVNVLSHMIDRVCIGRCFSYANYEPSTAAFRVRAVGFNPMVTADYGDSFKLQTGTYVLQERDIPLYKLDLEKGRLVVRPLKAGVPSGIVFWKVLS